MAHIRTALEAGRLAYSPAEAANSIGVARQTIYNLMQRGELRSVKIGRSRRIPASEVERLASEGTRGAS